MSKLPPEQIAGWFVYNRVNGNVTREKANVLRDNVHSDTRRYYESMRIIRFALDQYEFDNLSLDELQAKYPLPEKLREIP